MNSSAELKGKRALVTGATGGIGRAIVESLVEAGMKVVAQGRSEEKFRELTSRYPEIKCEKADLTNEDEVVKLAESSLKHFDGLDVLINNAGTAMGKNVADLEISEFAKVMTVNVNAVFILSKLIGKYMIGQSDGYIINIGSGASKSTFAGMSAYCASKHALLGFSESMALEMREYGVKVSIVMPGSTATGFGGTTAEKRLQAKPGILMPEDVANSVMYLLNQPKRAWSSQVNLRPLNPNKAF